MLSLYLCKWLYSLTTGSLAFSWPAKVWKNYDIKIQNAQNISHCCCSTRPNLKPQKCWTWNPLRTSCHRSESYIQHIHGGIFSMLVFNKKHILREPIPKTPNVLKTLTFVKVPYIYIYIYKYMHICFHSHGGYPLVITNMAMENHHFSLENSLWMVIFHSYVKLPEGTPK